MLPHPGWSEMWNLGQAERSFWLVPYGFSWQSVISTEESTQFKAEIPSSNSNKNCSSKTSWDFCKVTAKNLPYPNLYNSDI